MLDRLRGHHGTHIRSAGRIPDITGTSTDQSDRLISSHLKTLHQTQSHKMPYMKAVRRRVKPDIKSSLPVIDQFPDLLLIRHLGDQPPGLQFLINSHFKFSFSFYLPLTVYK